MPDWNWMNGWGAYNPPQFEPADPPQHILYQQLYAQAAMAQLLEARKPRVEVPKIEDEDTMINTFRVGCDPEFMLLDKEGKTVAASTYFPIHGPIGYDHGGRVAEFRPDPARGIYSLVRKIQGLIKSPTMKAVSARLRSGALCNRDCLGGHIHLGFNAFEEKPPTNVGIWGGGKFNARGAQVTKALDTLTKKLEYLDILPKNESAQRRASAQGQGNHYGEYGDVRDCNGHMEYRTMASWLYDPRVAFLCLTAAKLAAADPEGSYSALKDCDSFSDLMKWIETYKTKDLNAARVSEKLVGGGHKNLQIDPTVDFRDRWEELGL